MTVAPKTNNDKSIAIMFTPAFSMMLAFALSRQFAVAAGIAVGAAPSACCILLLLAFTLYPIV